MGDARKIATFAIAGALGCLAMALIGEAWLAMTWQPPVKAGPDRTIGLVLDASGSMDGPPLAEMKSAALEFVRGRDLSHERIAVVSFANFAKLACPLSADKNAIAAAIKNVNSDGATNMGAGLDTGSRVLGNE